LVEYQNNQGVWTAAGVQSVSSGVTTVTGYVYINSTNIGVVSNHFSTWGVFQTAALDSSTAGGGDILAPVPANSGSNICLYVDSNTANTMVASSWYVYSVSGYQVASLNFSNQPQQCWTTTGIARGLYYVKINITFADGSSRTEWHKVIVQ
jgi:hypothetical protein